MRKFAVLLAVIVLFAMPAARASTRLVATPACEEPVPTREYDDRSMSYGMTMDLAGCWWYEGGPIQLQATISRLDGTGEEGSTAIVLCGDRVLGEDRPTGRDKAGDEAADNEDAESEDAGNEDADNEDADGQSEASSPDDARHGDEDVEADDDADQQTAPSGDGGDEDGAGRRSRVAAADHVGQSARSSCEVSAVLEHSAAEVARYRGEITYPWRDGNRTVGFTAYCSSPVKVCHDG
jgi:hypothetical protein